jgi:hypothetical protein
LSVIYNEDDRQFFKNNMSAIADVSTGNGFTNCRQSPTDMSAIGDTYVGGQNGNPLRSLDEPARRDLLRETLIYPAEAERANDQVEERNPAQAGRDAAEADQAMEPEPPPRPTLSEHGQRVLADLKAREAQRRVNEPEPNLPLGPVVVTRTEKPKHRCSRCHKLHDGPGRYCRPCHAAYNREHRKKQRAELKRLRRVALAMGCAEPARARE